MTRTREQIDTDIKELDDVWPTKPYDTFKAPKFHYSITAPSDCTLWIVDKFVTLRKGETYSFESDVLCEWNTEDKK